MPLGRSIKRFFSKGSRQRSDNEEQRYDNVQVVNVADGTVIRGHDAVKAHFEHEREMYEEHGSSIIFELYRINLKANTVEALQGEKVGEIKVDGRFVSGEDSVAVVKSKLRSLLEEKAQSWSEKGSETGLHIEQADRLTLFFNSRLMRDDKLFYADHFMLLPAWVQVHVHSCEFETVVERAAELGNRGR